MTARVRMIGAIVIAGAAAALAAGATGGSAAPPSGTAPQTVLQAEALTRAAPAAGGSYDTPQLRSTASLRGVAVPLPAGGTFNGIQWENGGVGVTAGEIDGVLEYNSACQWLRAWRDGRDAPLAISVLQQAPHWPAMRGTESGDILTKVAADVSAGGGETATNVLRDCDASYARQTQYAAKLGLVPTR